MAGNTQPRAGAITGINVTPLVDITLVLLIIFMVTAKLIVSNKAMLVDLPKAATGDDVQQIFGVVLAADGPIEVNGARARSDDDVLALARTAHAANHDTRAVIQADGAVVHKRVMHVLDQLREAGIVHVGFGVVPARPGARGP